MVKRNQQFPTIRTEGAILPPDVLRRIASLRADGTTPDAYHLPPGSKLNEAISRSWTSLLNHWQAFQDARTKLPASDETATAITNERWLLPLFKELEYGRLVTTKSPEIDERVYPIERFYNHTPIHLIGCKLPLDRRTKGARGAATSSPHSMVQEFLNCSDECIWAFLTNGLQLRILRDNVSLSRQSFVEFDLEAMMEGEVYADFALLWLLCHQSRVETERPHECWLEKWSQLARDDGTRILKFLRVGVAKAIEALGRGFIGHPRNDRLRQKLQLGSLSKDEFYRQLLRIIYRLLFLFVAEDRDLLHPTDSSKAVQSLYDTHYSTRRLRDLALRMRGSKHSDLWHSLSLVFDALGRNDGCAPLGLYGLGSFLWQSSSTADVLGPHQIEQGYDFQGVFISNDDLLHAIRELAYVEQDRVMRMVDYRNLGSEELGSVYESLLELHPLMSVEAKSFELLTASGNERKLTGSYYTPDSLVQCLLDSALEPVVQDRLAGKRGSDAENVLLYMKICDPACGSGHFLIGAAHRLARHLARVRTGESEPGPRDYQHALRDVIGRCIYGVDINPMAVELCKVALWMEAMEPGKPLSYLDHHIQCGNSLLGTTPALMKDGIPNEAFAVIEGDVKSCVSDLKKQNKRERHDYASGQGYLFEPYFKLGNIAADFARLNAAPDATLADVAALQVRYVKLIQSSEYASTRLLADTWCAAFVWKKDTSELGNLCPTERYFRRIESHAAAGLLPHVRAEVERLRDQYQFFHWHLTFPDVFRLTGNNETPENEQTGWNGGFDAILSNPPWERVNLKEQEWFAERRPDIANAPNAAARKRLIKALRTEDPSLDAEFQNASRHAEGESHILRNAGLHPLCGIGEINLYAVFAEGMRNHLGSAGRIGCVLPSGIATDDTTKLFFQDVVARKSLVSLFDFENRAGLFPAVDSRMKFCLFTSGSPTRSIAPKAEFVFFAHGTEDLESADRRITLGAEEISLVNPNTRTCPIFRQRSDSVLTTAVYRRAPVLLKEMPPAQNPWDIVLSRMFHMTDDSHLFRTCEQLVADGFTSNANVFHFNAQHYLPLYEAKMGQIFDHRAADVVSSPTAMQRKAQPDPLTVEEHQNPLRYTKPLYWIPEHELRDRIEKKWNRDWLLGFTNVTSPTNERTFIATIFPVAGVGNSMPLVFGSSPATAFAMMTANFSAFVFDYVVRQKIGGVNLNYYVVHQLPVLPPTLFVQQCSWTGTQPSAITNQQFLLPRVMELTYTAWDLEPFARDCGYAGTPFRWDEERRFRLRAELDAAFFHLYLPANPEGRWVAAPNETPEDLDRVTASFPTPRDAVDYIMNTFPIVRRKDEENYNGDYRTKRVILEVYDAMQTAIRTSEPYQTRVDPPPADPRIAHPPRRQQLAYGDVVADILLLLREWNSAVSILALEPGVLLMQNEQARNTFLDRVQAKATTDQSQPAYKIVEGMDLVYQGLVVNGAIAPVGQNGYRLLKPELIAELSGENRQRARQVVEAIKKLDHPEDALAIVAEVTHDRYAVAVS